MYIINNALRSIFRAKGRNILIGIIALAIAISACVALSIKESASKAREGTLSLMNITAHITRDNEALMKDALKEKEGSDKNFDRDSLKNILQGGAKLTLSEYQVYAEAESVKDSYYTLSVTLDAVGNLEPFDIMGTIARGGAGQSSLQSQQKLQGNDNPGGGSLGKMGAQGDFTVVGYSGDNAMTDFTSGNCSITYGAVFDVNTTANECIVSEELATYNNLAIGSEIVLANPNNAEETFIFTVVGIYKNNQQSANGFMGGTAANAANKIMTSYNALQAICDKSSQNASEGADTGADLTSSTAIYGMLDYTYVLSDVDAYNDFVDDVQTLGLSNEYRVVSTDLTQFENSLVPLENLSKTAGYFLLVVFIVGAVILVVINVFNIRERKYEIGVLTAIGMKKWKVASQFVTELFVVTLAAIILGAGIGAAVSVPVTNALLSAQITANQQTQENLTQGFGRDTEAFDGGMVGMPSRPEDGQAPEKPENGLDGFMGDVTQGAQNVISEVSYSTDLVVIAELIGVGVLLTIISSLAAVMFIMRYEPLKILTNRD